MNTVLLTAGVVSLMAAVVGGGLKAFNVHIPVLQSRGVRAALGLLGVVFLVAAIVLRDGGGGGDPDPQTARYQQQAAATCGAVRRLVARDIAGLPEIEPGPAGGAFIYDRDKIVAGGRSKVNAIAHRLTLMLEKPAPRALEQARGGVRRHGDTYVRDARALVRDLRSMLSPKPTQEQLEAFLADYQEQSDEDVGRLEDAMTQLAGRECSLTAEGARTS